MRIVAGGWMANLNFIKEIFQLPISQNFIRAGLAFNDTIYVIKATECISNHVYVHELTHVWQFQNGHQPLQIWEASAYLYLQAKSPSTLYDFGGYDRLRSAHQEGKPFYDFSTEQQAEIVRFFYIYKKNERIAQFFDVSEEEAVKFASSDLAVDFLQILENYRWQMLNEVPKNY